MRGCGVSIASTKLANAYTEVSDRADTCGGCALATPTTFGNRMRCKEGFFVARGGWCRKHTPRVGGDFNVQQLPNGDFEVHGRTTPAGTPLVNCGKCSAVQGCLVVCVRGDGRTRIGPIDI